MNEDAKTYECQNPETGSDNTLYASCVSTLTDFLKTGLCKGKHVHCAFPINIDDMNIKLWINTEMVRKGIRSIYFEETGIIELNVTNGDKANV